jgi:molybdopterin-binding protein
MVKKLSARNQLAGRVIDVHKGQTTAHVKVDIGNGVIVFSSITNEAVDDLGLAVGDNVVAIIKASDVMIAK